MQWMVALFALGLWVYFAWPVSLWLITTSLCAVICHSVATKRDRSLSGAIAKLLKETAIWISVGLGIVAAAQAILLTVGDVSRAAVRALEDAAIEAQQELTSFLSLPILAPILVVLLLVNLLWPESRAVTRFVSIRKGVKRAFLILTGIVSFTFFSTLAVETEEPRWLAQRRMETTQAIGQVDTRRRELVALAWIDRRVASLPHGTVQELRDILIESVGSNESKIGRTVDALIKTAPRIRSFPKETDDFQQVRAWAKSDSVTPSLAQTSIVIAEARRLDRVVPEVEAAVTETLKNAIGELVPGAIDLLIRPFIKALGSALVERALSRLILDDIADAQAARAFVERTLKVNGGGSADTTLVALWQWKFAEERSADIPPMENRGTPTGSSAPPSGTPYGEGVGDSRGEPELVIIIQPPVFPTVPEPWHRPVKPGIRHR